MALTAKFTADFSQFESAIKGAAVTVTTFEKGVKNAAADLSKLASSLSGAEIQRQATIAAERDRIHRRRHQIDRGGSGQDGGADRSGDREIQGARATSPAGAGEDLAELQEVQQNTPKRPGDSASGIGAKFKSELAGIGPAVVGAFSVGAIIGFGKELLESGRSRSPIHRTSSGSARTRCKSCSMRPIRPGTTLDTFAGGMVKLQDKLVEGSKGTLEAFERLNLSIEDVKRQNVDQAFTSVAEAIAGVEDPMEQTQLAMELFGKAGVEALPAIDRGWPRSAKRRKSSAR